MERVDKGGKERGGRGRGGRGNVESSVGREEIGSN